MMSKTKSTKLTYDVFHVKRDPATLSFKVTKGKDENGDAIDLPVAGEKIGVTTMHESNAMEYNLHWESTGKFMQQAAPQKAAAPAAKQQESDEEQDSLKEQFPDVFAMTKPVLISNCETFGLSTEGNVGVLKARVAQYLLDNK